MYPYLVIHSGHQTPLRNPFVKIHCFQQKGEVTDCVPVKSQETEGKTVAIILSCPHQGTHLKEMDRACVFKRDFLPVEMWCQYITAPLIRASVGPCLMNAWLSFIYMVVLLV